MLKISGTTITLTRGDSASIALDLHYKDGEPYEPAEGDTIRFAMKKTYSDLFPPLLTIDISTEDLILYIPANDTKALAYGSYKYDIQLTTASGDVDTFIDRATIDITEEVD